VHQQLKQQAVAALAYEAERQRAKLVVAFAAFLLREEKKVELKEVETKENAPEAMRTRSGLRYRWTLQNGRKI